MLEEQRPRRPRGFSSSLALTLDPLSTSLRNKNSPLPPPPPSSFHLLQKPLSKMTSSIKTLLGAGAVLHRGEKLASPNGKAEAKLQDDGNFVVYVDGKDVWAR